MNAGKIVSIILLLATLIGCSNRQSKQTDSKNLLTAIGAEFPLNLGAVNLNDTSSIVSLTEEVFSKIDAVVKEYASTIMWDERYPHTAMDAYINTIRLQAKQHTIYVVLLKHFPMTERLSSVVLFYDNQKNEFVKEGFDLGIYNLYLYYDGKLNPTNLKTEFNIISPELELVDFNLDGIDDFKFTRLIHNGTYNAIETVILTPKGSAFDTLYFEEKSLMNFDLGNGS